MYSELGWLTVDEMIAECDAALLDKILTREEAPEAMTTSVTFRSDVKARATRSSEAAVLQLPLVKTELARRSFFYRAMSKWNSQDVSIRRHFNNGIGLK